MSREQLVFEEMFRDCLYGPRDGMTPRQWQEECVEKYWDSVRNWSGVGPHVFCIYAGTGAGKTKAGGLIAATALNSGEVDQIVVVCPNRSILGKTKKDFLRFFGIELARFHKAKHGNGVPRMQQGYILTYQALLNDPTKHRRLCQSSRTLVIFDEIHHLGDDSKWGKDAEEAFSNVAFIVALTGTPYRSDNTRIPFVRYEETGDESLLRFKADFPYSLGRAVADGVCRKPLFLWYDGEIRIRLGPDSPEFTANFDHKVNATVASLLLRGAVAYGSTDRKGMLRQALARCREEKRKVIIFLGGDTDGDCTPTQDATTFLPEELEDLGISSSQFEIVTGDDNQAQQKIESFGADPEKWILVSINMVSEGTDIPEISAAIFLTSITAKQTTVQRIGRALRLMGPTDPHPDALIFMFRDKELVKLGVAIDSEIKSEINLRKQKRDPGAEGDGSGNERRFRAEAIGIGDGAMRMVTFNGQSWPAEVFEEVSQTIKSRGLPPTMLRTAMELEMNRRSNEHY